MKLDAKTLKAIAQFQEDSGGTGYDVLDYTTQQWLNEKLDSLMLQFDNPYKKAIETLGQ